MKLEEKTEEVGMGGMSVSVCVWREWGVGVGGSTTMTISPNRTMIPLQ